MGQWNLLISARALGNGQNDDKWITCVSSMIKLCTSPHFINFPRRMVHENLDPILISYAWRGSTTRDAWSRQYKLRNLEMFHKTGIRLKARFGQWNLLISARALGNGQNDDKWITCVSSMIKLCTSPHFINFPRRMVHENLDPILISYAWRGSTTRDAWSRQYKLRNANMMNGSHTELSWFSDGSVPRAIPAHLSPLPTHQTAWLKWIGNMSLISNPWAFENQRPSSLGDKKWP